MLRSFVKQKQLEKNTFGETVDRNCEWETKRGL